MNVELTEIRSTHPDFEVPKGHNGEPLSLYLVSPMGSFMIVRYWGQEPKEGPITETFFLDVYYNSYGREIFRVKALMTPDPPERPGLFKRLRAAWRDE